MQKQIFNESSMVVPVKDYPFDLQWNSSLGIGYLPSNGYEYGKEYWQHYLECSASVFGETLTQLRAKFVKDYVGSYENLCDVGVGSGQFVDFVKCKGTDVNPYAITWLKGKNLFVDDLSQFAVLSLWDVIEHIDNPAPLVSNASCIFISTPVYKDLNSCLTSKHFKPGEHVWYFTDAGVKHFMSLLGFEVYAESDFETVLGRDSILSYCFKRA